MNKLNLVFRRVHLYLGMTLFPWVLVYGISSSIINHGPLFRDTAQPPKNLWRTLWEKDYSIEVPLNQSDLRPVAQRILRDQSIESGFFVNRAGQRLNINVANFLHPRRLTYWIDQKRLVAEERETVWNEVFTRMHTRGGYHQPGILNWTWAFVLDLVCLSMLLWIATGLYLWWKIPATRYYGFAAIAAGLATFVVFVCRL